MQSGIKVSSIKSCFKENNNAHVIKERVFMLLFIRALSVR